MEGGALEESCLLYFALRKPLRIRMRLTAPGGGDRRFSTNGLYGGDGNADPGGVRAAEEGAFGERIRIRVLFAW